MDSGETSFNDTPETSTVPASNAPAADIIQVPLVQDDLTFDVRQAMRLKDMERRISDETRRKKKEWEQNVERMREEFLNLLPKDGQRGEEELTEDKLIVKRRGSTDVLDNKAMKTLLMDYPDSGRRYKLRFNVVDFEPDNIAVTTDGERIVVTATRSEVSEHGITREREYERKIEKPKEVDHMKLKSFLTTDGILIIEAPLPPKTLHLDKTCQPSPTRSAAGSRLSNKAGSSPPSHSPPRYPAKETIGVPTFVEDGGRRKLTLTVDVGTGFSAKEITVLIIKDNRLKVKAKHEEKSTEKLCKSKYAKEFELPERIETCSLRGGVTSEGILHVGALAKGHAAGLSKVAAGDVIVDDLNAQLENQSCNVLDLSSFPPTTPQIIASSCNSTY